MVEEKFECCICGKESVGFGNNPWPVQDEGQCCNACNWTIVIPARMKHFKEVEEKNGQASN